MRILTLSAANTIGEERLPLVEPKTKVSVRFTGVQSYFPQNITSEERSVTLLASINWRMGLLHLLGCTMLPWWGFFFKKVYY